jgi:hypothetical protein
MLRWMSALVGAVGFPLVHGVLPWGLSLLSQHYGWSERGAGRWNLLQAYGATLVLKGLMLSNPARRLMNINKISIIRNPRWPGG